MVKALVDIDEHANRVLNIVKAKWDLKDKSEAINLVTRVFEEDELEPALRPEFVARLKRIEKGKIVHIGSLQDFRKKFKLD